LGLSGGRPRTRYENGVLPHFMLLRRLRSIMLN